MSIYVASSSEIEPCLEPCLQASSFAVASERPLQLAAPSSYSSWLPVHRRPSLICCFRSFASRDFSNPPANRNRNYPSTSLITCTQCLYSPHLFPPCRRSQFQYLIDGAASLELYRSVLCGLACSELRARAPCIIFCDRYGT
jgi:hypothetical protein